MTTPKNEISLDQVRNAQSLSKLDQLLTQSMAIKEFQALIKEDNLNVVIESVMNLAQNNDDKHKLLAVAMLGRLAAVARSRSPLVLKQIPNLITKEPLSLNVLSDRQLTSTSDNLGKIKHYAAQSLRYIDADWLPDYCLREAINIDAAENARNELLSIALEKYGNATEWIIAIATQCNVLNPITDSDARLKRVLRLFSAILKQLQQWQGELGDNPGEALEKLFANFVHGKSHNVEKSLLFKVLDCSIEMLLRSIELRFSIALHEKTYAIITKSRGTIGMGRWSEFTRKSDKIDRLRVCLLEAALVLARQRQTDSKIMTVIALMYSSQPQVCSAIERHFKSALDLEPECYDWWRSAGTPTVSKREVEHKFQNTEDEQIGSLLIEVENGKEFVEKLNSAVVPLIEISDTALASTVKKTARGYSQIIQIVRRLARMRKLNEMGLKSELLQYNRNEHEMLGGHRSGVRKVKVIRDGITKEFGGRKKTLVKAWVEPGDEI